MPLYIFDMEEVSSFVAGGAEVRALDPVAVLKKRAGKRREKKPRREETVELTVFPKFVPAPSSAELIDLASAYNSSLGW